MYEKFMWWNYKNHLKCVIQKNMYYIYNELNVERKNKNEKSLISLY